MRTWTSPSDEAAINSMVREWFSPPADPIDVIFQGLYRLRMDGRPPKKPFDYAAWLNRIHGLDRILR